MKKIILFIIIIFFVNIKNFAQEEKRLSYQIDLGTSIALPYKQMIYTYKTHTMDMTTPYTEYKSDYGYYAEGLIKYNLINKFSITTGFNYKYISYKIKDVWGLNISEGNINNSTLSIPFLLNYKLSDKIPLSVSAGPYIEFVINAQELGVTHIDTSYITVIDPNDPMFKDQDYNNNITKDYKMMSIGFSTQLEYELKFSKKISGILLSRFNYGLSNVLIIDDEQNHKTAKNSANIWKNYNILIGVGIRI